MNAFETISSRELLKSPELLASIKADDLMEMVLQSSKRLMEVLNVKKVSYQQDKVGEQELGHDQKLRFHGSQTNWNIHYHKDKWKTCSHEKLILKASQSLSNKLFLNIGRNVVFGDVEEEPLDMYDITIKNSLFGGYKSIFENQTSDSSPWEQAKAVMAVVIESLESEIATIDSNVSITRDNLVENAKRILGVRF